jgi:hypothetical protein
MLTVKHILVVSAGEIELSEEEYRALYPPPTAEPQPSASTAILPTDKTLRGFPAASVPTVPPEPTS